MFQSGLEKKKKKKIKTEGPQRTVAWTEMEKVVCALTNAERPTAENKENMTCCS